jgi:hypothetical protein
VYEHLRIHCLSEPHAETPPVLPRESTAQRPVEVGFLWSGGGGHVILVRWVTGHGLYAVNDPWYRQGLVTYLNLMMAYGMGRWGMSFGDCRNV